MKNQGASSGAPPVSQSGGRRRRMFTPGELEALLLKLLHARPRHGYDIIGELEALSGASYAPSAGILYPALQKLEREGAIELVDAPRSRRRTYALTPRGAEILTSSAHIAQSVLERIASLRAPTSRTPGDQIHAAVERLNAALATAAAGLPEQVEAQVAAKLDDLALLIRRASPKRRQEDSLE